MNKLIRIVLLVVAAIFVVIIVNALDVASRSTVSQIAILVGILGLVWCAERFWNAGRMK